MKVGYIAPASIAVVNGGLRTQANMTIECMKLMGIDTIKLSPWDQNVDQLNLDLIHIFGATSENLGIMSQLAYLNIPLVLSPVFYSNRTARVVNLTVKAEKLLGIFGSGIRSDFSIKKELCDMADLILPNTQNEARLIQKGLGIPSFKLKVIPNGVEKRFSKADSSLFINKFGIKDFVLFAGQVSAKRKNVLGLLEVAQNIDADVVIIGSFDESTYSQKCLAIAKKTDNVFLIESLEHNSELLSSAYAAAKVFVLPSYYETPGISALEAALADTNIVITKYGGTKEYFKDHAIYLDPSSKKSIQNAIKLALSKGKDPTLKERILLRYTWDTVAEKTLERYQEILG